MAVGCGLGVSLGGGSGRWHLWVSVADACMCCVNWVVCVCCWLSCVGRGGWSDCVHVCHGPPAGLCVVLLKGYKE